MSIANHFRNKIVSAQRNTHIVQILCRVGYHPKKGFLEGIFCLCVENVMHVLVPFFSDKVMVLEDSSHTRYWWSYLAKQVVHLKLHWNVNLVRCPKFATHQVTLVSIVPIYPIYRLSGTFL